MLCLKADHGGASVKQESYAAFRTRTARYADEASHAEALLLILLLGGLDATKHMHAHSTLRSLRHRQMHLLHRA